MGFNAILEEQGSSSLGLICAVWKLFTLPIGFPSAIVTLTCIYAICLAGTLYLPYIPKDAVDINAFVTIALL